MFCSISGTVPEDPVISKKSGHLFERRLIEKYIRETGKCPITQESLSLEELLPVQNAKTVKPRTTPATSIPGLLGIFHDEWDALMLESHNLRQQLHTMRQELSHALYQNDAACRVIARLIRERDDARAALDNVRESVAAELEAKKRQAAAEAAAAADAPAPAKRAKTDGLPEAVVEELAAVSTELSKGRKKRQVPADTATVEQLEAYTLQGSYPLHKTTAGGILSIDLLPGQENVVATGGADGSVQLYDLQQQQSLGQLSGHTKRVTAVQFATPQLLLSSSADKTLRMWAPPADASEPGSGFACASVLSEHSAAVVGLAVHPSHHYCVSASEDASWCFWDLKQATCLKQVQLAAGEGGYSAVSFHPDGLILGTGTQDKLVRVWELRTQKNVAQFEGHAGPVLGLSFSENGYHLATAAADGVKLWDLRKLKNIRALTPYEDTSCTSVAFDHSGLYLAVGGSDARIYGSKNDWSVIKTFPDVPKKGVTALRFSSLARQLLVGGADHNLRVFAAAAPMET